MYTAYSYTFIIYYTRMSTHCLHCLRHVHAYTLILHIPTHHTHTNTIYAILYYTHTGLQATLIIRHPDDSKLYVNFDPEILQLIREAKCLDRLGIHIVYVYVYNIVLCIV